MDGHEQADELARDGAEEDGGATVAAKGLTIKQLRTDILCFYRVRGACSRPSGELEKTGMRLRQRNKKSGNVCARKVKAGSTGRNDVRTWCMRCGKRSKKENIPGICLGIK